MATPAPILEDRRQGVVNLESELSALRIRLATEESDRAALETERTELSEKIALGEMPASKASALARRVEESETRLAGFRSVITRKQAQLDALWPELRALEAETRLAARRAEVEALKAQGAELVARLNEKLAAIITGDLPELDAIRDRLANEFRDVGGEEARAELGRALLMESGTLVEEEKLTDRTKWRSGEPIWKIRGDVVLTVRNLWKPATR